MNHKVKLGRLKKNVSRALSVVLSAALFVSGLSASFTTTVSAETLDNVVMESIADVTPGDTFDTADVDAEEVAVVGADADLGYKDFTEDTLIETLNFGSGITASNTFDGAKGFSDVEYNTEAKGWDGGVYYPREISKSEAGASYVTDGTDYLAIGSKVWTETESSGQGVYTYENTSSYDMKLAPADYKVSVTLTNPTETSYTAYLEAEDITKIPLDAEKNATDITVAAGETVTKEFIAVLVDGTLNLKFLAQSSAVEAEAAVQQNVYVSQVKITRLKTEEAGEKPTIFVASDSTVQSYEDYDYPKTGWGQTLYEFFGEEVDVREAENARYSQCHVYEAENVIVENCAIGGRSSSSFVQEGKLDDLLEDIKQGDYLFIQWGHNDATATRPNRYVAPENFEHWIQFYVDGAKQRGATPVLVTPVARHSYTTDENGKLISFAANFAKYGDVMKKMAAEQDLALIDLTERSIALCNSFGIEGAKALFMIFGAGEYPNHASGSNDSTHLSYYGAYKFAQCVATGIQESTHSDLAELKELVKVTLPETVPGAVTDLVSTTVGASSISMKWNAADGTELYYIYRQVLEEGQTVDDVDFTAEGVEKYSATSNTAYTDGGCEAGTTYVYAVRGFNELGLGEFSDKITVKTKEAGFKFDINYGVGPTQSGWIGILADMYDEEIGYGWITYPGNGRDRGSADMCDFPDMGRDFTLGAGEFAVDLPNGDYEVTVYGGDSTSTNTQKTGYLAEGNSIGSIAVKLGVASTTEVVRVEDGQLNIEVVSAGTSLLYFNGFTITEILTAPTGFGYSEVSVDPSTGKADYLIHFNPVEEAVSYKVYTKNSTDKDYSVAKEFTAEEFAADSLGCRAMAGDAGETYSLYITCVTAAGDESARSNIVELPLVEEGDKAVAPTNLVCTSPTADETELKESVSLAWDTVDGAFKYIIYRSEKAEGQKGFKEFEKVGESKTNAYTDSEVTTNMHYYYKVAAMTVTGLGAYSEACQSPVTGKLVAVNRESYADRAVVAINLAGADGGETNVTATDSEGNEYTEGVYLSWRAFEADLDEDNNVTTTFTLYRDGVEIDSNLKVTNLIDPAGTANSVYKVVGSNDSELGLTAKDTVVWANKYLELNLYAPAAGVTPDHGNPIYDKEGNVSGYIDGNHTYEANDMSVGDLNGDGDLELIVKWYPSNAKDNSSGNCTGKTYLDGYDVDFTTGEVSLLWRIDMGVNIRSGAHYTQFQVWDYDGDGKAEIAVKTADGTTTYKSADGTVAGLEMTSYVGACSTEELPVNTFSGAENYDYRNASGYVLDGHEYFSIFNGEDGTKAADDVDYIPERGNVSAWGDAYGNRVDRHLSATAYLNGTTPFAVFARGYYSRTCLTAYYMKDTNGDNVGDTIDVYWRFDTNDVENGKDYEAQGNHGLSVNDIDNDGKDEIIYGALVIDHDGTIKYSTNLGHGDAMHVSDWVSWNDGLEIMSVHEHGNVAYDVEVHDAETGVILMGYHVGKDTGRGVAADIDPTAEGAEWWSIASPTFDENFEPAWDSTDGEVYSSWSTLEDLIALSESTPASNASIFWDGDLLSEVQDHDFNEKGGYVPIGVKIYKWNYEEGKQEALLDSTEIWSTNGTKGNVGLAADILGDWREEIIARTSADRNVVRVYSTTIETDYVVPCLLENLAYREGVAWQNVGYNQPANLSYLLSEGLVTSELMEGTILSNSAEIAFTPANDGDTYGHEITGYNIYRAVSGGDFELVESVSTGDLKTGTVGGDEEVEPEGPKEPEIIGWKDGAVIGQYDFSSKNGVGEGFTAIQVAEYSEEVGYGFTNSGTIKANAVGVVVSPVDSENVTAIETACKDLTYALDGNLNFVVDVPAGSYRVDVYAGAAVKNNAYNNNSISVNGTELGVVSQSAAVADMLKTTTVTLEEAGQITITATNEGQRAFLNAVVITEMQPIYEDVSDEDGSESDEEQDGPKTETKVETLFEEDFEDGTSAFTLITADYTDYEFLQADTSTVNKNNSKYVYGVGKRSGDVGTQLTTALGIDENVTVAFDLKMDACDGTKTSRFGLIKDQNTLNYIDNNKTQIMTISAKAAATGQWGTIDVNGITIGDVVFEDETKATTGWLRVEADLDFEKQMIDLTVTRISDSSVVYEGEVAFASEVSSLEYIFFSSNRSIGGVYTDNILITKKTEVVVEEPKEDDNGEETYYIYTDENLTGNTTYIYKIAAVVDGKASHMSRPLTLTTAIEIGEYGEFEIAPLVEGTPLADGQTVADLLPQTLPVTDVDGNKLDSEVTWDVSAVDINKVGKYTIYLTYKGEVERHAIEVEVVANEIKGIEVLEPIEIIAGAELTLPEKVAVEFTNTTKDVVAVTWNQDNLDVNTPGEYTLSGTVEGYDEWTATIVINVLENYIVNVPDTTIEVENGETNVKEKYPVTVKAEWANGKTTDVPVVWDDVEVDTSVVGSPVISGTVEGYATAVKLFVNVKYPTYARFDFGIYESEVNPGWIGVTVNPKGSAKTMKELDAHYTEEKGYGFLNPNATFQGRSENYTYEGTIPKDVYKDFAMPYNETFVVDVPNGTYQVEIIAGSATNGNNDVKGNVEGTVNFNVRSTGGKYNITSVTADVTDGQLTIAFTNQNCRTDGIIVRAVDVDGWVPATSVALNTTKVTLNRPETVSLVATVSPEDATTELAWSSSDKKVATVVDGVVTPIAGGTANIVVKTTNGKYAICEVTVKVPATGIELEPTATVAKGAELTLKAMPVPADTTDKVTWTSSNTEVATINENGVVTALSVGTTTITAEVNGFKATCELTVNIPATEVAVDKTEVTLTKGQTVNLVTTVTPGDATDELTWTSSDENVATVSNGDVIAVGGGSAIITVTADSGVYATCNITVNVPATGITLSQSSVTLNKGESATLKATMAPADTTDTYKWTTSNAAVATVVDGVVTAVGEGNATITVTTSNGLTATCTVTVKVPVVVQPTPTPTVAPTATPTPTVAPVPGAPVVPDEPSDATYKFDGDGSGVTVSSIDKTATKITIPNTITVDGKEYPVTGISKNAFKNNKKITSITIGNNVTAIGDYAFYGCTKLTTVKIGKNVETIGRCAFNKCTSLKSITIPDKVKTVGVSAFDGCTKLTTVKLGKSLTAISDKMFYKCTSLKKVTIPSKVTKIGKSAFASCTKLASVTIGKKVSSIGSNAFYKCTSLKKVTIPSGVKTIGGSAFSGCTKLATLTIGSKVTTIDKNAFNKCTALKKVTIPASVKTIGANAFNGCKNLKSITIKTTKLTKKTLGNKAFSGIHAKATIKVPSKKLAEYKKLLVSKGVKKTATIKK